MARNFVKKGTKSSAQQNSKSKKPIATKLNASTKSDSPYLKQNAKMLKFIAVKNSVTASTNQDHETSFAKSKFSRPNQSCNIQILSFFS